MATSQHGGAREGAGRKPLAEEQLTKPRTVWMTDEEWEYCKDREKDSAPGVNDSTKRGGDASMFLRTLVLLDRWDRQAPPKEDELELYRSVITMIFDCVPALTRQCFFALRAMDSARYHDPGGRFTKLCTDALNNYAANFTPEQRERLAKFALEEQDATS